MSTPARDPAVHYGRSHDVLPPDDDAALADFFAEQHARLEVIRRNEIWDWLGGNVLSFSHPERLLRGVWTEIASMALLVLTILVAGFTHGPVLWSFAALTLACLVLGRWLRTQPLRLTAAHYRRAGAYPAAVFASGTAREDEHAIPFVHALVGFEVRNWKELRQLVAAAERLEALVAGRAEAPVELREFVGRLRADLEAKVCDTTRLELPAAFGLPATEVVRMYYGPQWLPDGRLDSRLLFVLADRAHRGPDRSRVMFHNTWGCGAASLAAHFPLGGEA